jgi:hypothetical protein
MECDICGQDVKNSEELQTHRERMHPAVEDDKSKDNLEKPDLLGDTLEESATSEAPLPTH